MGYGAERVGMLECVLRKRCFLNRRKRWIIVPFWCLPDVWSGSSVLHHATRMLYDSEDIAEGPERHTGL